MDLGTVSIDHTFIYMKTLDDGNCRKIYRLTELIAVPLEAHGRIIKETLADRIPLIE